MIHPIPSGTRDVLPDELRELRPEDLEPPVDPPPTTTPAATPTPTSTPTPTPTGGDAISQAAPEETP